MIYIKLLRKVANGYGKLIKLKQIINLAKMNMFEEI